MKTDALWSTSRAWIEIHAGRLRHNAAELKRAMPDGCELMAVVKADAYGHGACEVSRQLNQAGVSAFAVATIEEGMALRESGVSGEILILGYTDVRRAREISRYDLSQTLIGLDYAKALNAQGVALKAHLKIDTGMGRLGIWSGDVSGARSVFFMGNLDLCGMFTHLCRVEGRNEADAAFTKEQAARFYRLAGALKESGIRLPKLHVQSSYGFLNYPEISCDYVRAGLALYGALGEETRLRLNLCPALSLKSRIALIRSVKKGSGIGYGKSFTVRRDSRIAILPIGYGDGFPRSLSCGKGSVRIRERLAPVAGRVCMDQLAVDVTDVEGAAEGDEAALICADGCSELSAPAVAKRSGSISNELLCRLSARLPVVLV